MTKRRAPLSFAQAVTRIAGLITFEEMARITGRTERAVRDWSDPDSNTTPTLEQAFALDRAYHAAGGGEAPIMQAYALRLELDCHSDESATLAAATASAAKESGEAIAALVSASTPGASPQLRAAAMREGQQAIDAITRAMGSLGHPVGSLK